MKSVLTHGTLAAFGLILAYTVWTDVEAPDEVRDDVVVWDCGADRITEVSFTTDRREVTLAQEGKGDEAYTWITTSRKKASDESEKKAFVGNKEVKTLLDKLGPLKAKRALGQVKKDVAKDLKLTEPEGTLAITCGGKKRAFDIGDRAYGSGDRYAREAKKKKSPVYMLEASLVNDLESAQVRLMQRELHRFDMTEVEHLTVQAYGAERKLLQRNRLDPRQASWVDAAEPDTRNELYGNWLDRVHRLRVVDYLAVGEEPGSDPPDASEEVERIGTLTYQDKDNKPVGKLELARAGDDYYARSNATRAWVRVTSSIAKQVRTDIRPVVGLEALPEEPEPAAAESTSEGASVTAPPTAAPTPTAAPPAHPMPARPMPAHTPHDPHAGH